jgi:hypothetical protein
MTFVCERSGSVVVPENPIRLDFPNPVVHLICLAAAQAAVPRRVQLAVICGWTRLERPSRFAHYLIPSQ